MNSRWPFAIKTEIRSCRMSFVAGAARIPKARSRKLWEYFARTKSKGSLEIGIRQSGYVASSGNMASLPAYRIDRIGSLP
jgi:hypothetical protein